MTQQRRTATVVAFLFTCAVAVLASACSQTPLSPSALGTAGVTGPSPSLRAGDGNTPIASPKPAGTACTFPATACTAKTRTPKSDRACTSR